MHVPMSWAGELPDESHRGRPLLVCNESHFVNQGNQTPAQVAAIIASLSGWGDLVIGNWHYKDGREHAEETCKMLGPSGAVRALGVHVYSILSEPVRDGIWLDRLRWWKQFADEQGLPIWVTEWGFLGHPADTIVQRMAGLGETIRVVLRPQYMFWFSWRYGAYWPPSDMWDGARLTPVGREWMRLYGR